MTLLGPGKGSLAGYTALTNKGTGHSAAGEQEHYNAKATRVGEIAAATQVDQVSGWPAVTLV